MAREPPWRHVGRQLTRRQSRPRDRHGNHWHRNRKGGRDFPLGDVGREGARRWTHGGLSRGEGLTSWRDGLGPGGRGLTWEEGVPHDSAGRGKVHRQLNDAGLLSVEEEGDWPVDSALLVELGERHLGAADEFIAEKALFVELDVYPLDSVDVARKRIHPGGTRPAFHGVRFEVAFALLVLIRHLDVG